MTQSAHGLFQYRFIFHPPGRINETQKLDIGFPGIFDALLSSGRHINSRSGFDQRDMTVDRNATLP
jgi:hypothetical protein